MITLHDIRETDRDLTSNLLYEMLAERDPIVNISHKEMPPFEQHQYFVDRYFQDATGAYKVWWLILERYAKPVGQAYITAQNEIGIQVMKEHQRRGIAGFALRDILHRYDGERLLANINPENEASINLFRAAGFKLLQYTFELERA